MPWCVAVGSQLVRPRCVGVDCFGVSTAWYLSVTKATTTEQREARENGCRSGARLIPTSLGNRKLCLPIAVPLMSAEGPHRERIGSEWNFLLPSAVGSLSGANLQCGPGCLAFWAAPKFWGSDAHHGSVSDFGANRLRRPHDRLSGSFTPRMFARHTALPSN
jgi:hypothetical protein